MCVHQQSSADFQYGQTVKNNFAVRSSGQAVKVKSNGQNCLPVLAVNTEWLPLAIPV